MKIYSRMWDHSSFLLHIFCIPLQAEAEAKNANLISRFAATETRAASERAKKMVRVNFMSMLQIV